VRVSKDALYRTGLWLMHALRAVASAQGAVGGLLLGSLCAVQPCPEGCSR